MSIKDIKAEARRKLALNIHQAVVIYTIEFTLMITLIALIVISCLCLNSITWIAAVVMICFGTMLLFIAVVGINMVDYAMVDFYVTSYKCKPYNIRRLGDTLARSGMTKIFLISLKRTFLGFLLLLCLIVPGIIYLIRTSMANYLLVANPKMKASTALSASNKVMSGKTGGYFSLCMSLIGWWMLGFITLGFGFIFIRPYINLVKAVYYKRNLQGDKAEYVVAVQPVSAVSYPTTVQPVREHSESTEQPAVQFVTEEPIAAPIDALGAADLREMNEAMRDFGGGDVLEIPVSPPVADSGQKSADTVISTPIDGTNLVETERVLTTFEANEAGGMFDKKLDEMYSHTDPLQSDRDYVSGLAKETKSGDFVTSEVDSVSASGAEVTELYAEPSAAASAEPRSIMNDDRFAEFIREFGSTVPEPEPEFKPLQRSAAADRTEIKRASERPTDTDKDISFIDTTEPVVREHKVVHQERQKPVVTPPPQRHEPDRNAIHAAHLRPSSAAAKEEPSRAERMKREREERLNRLKKQ